MERNRFTLIELLVVIAIISILAAMLLPALEAARFEATKISCLSDRRQNYMSLQYFTNDHDGVMPYPVGDTAWQGPDGSKSRDYYTWLGYGRYGEKYERDAKVPRWFVGKNGRKFVNGSHVIYNWDGNNAKALASTGVLAAFGYISTPELLYCPAFNRPPEEDFNVDQNDNYYVDKYLRFWEALTDADGDIPNQTGYGSYGSVEEQGMGATMVAGIVNYLGIDNYQDEPHNLRLTDYSMRWKKKDSTSPLMYSCTNLGVSDFYTMEYKEEGISHEARGVNGVFVDGSARWISWEEVENSIGSKYYKEDPGFLSNTHRNAYLQRWARGKRGEDGALTIAGPK